MLPSSPCRYSLTTYSQTPSDAPQSFSHSHHNMSFALSHRAMASGTHAPHSPTPTPPYSTCSAPIGGAQHMFSLFRFPKKFDPVRTPDPVLFGQASSASGSENKPLPHLHVAITYWRSHWNPRMLSRLYNNLDGFPFVAHASHSTPSLRSTHSSTGSEWEKQKKKWREMLSYLLPHFASSPYSSSCSAQPPPATTTMTPSARASSSSRDNAPANSPQTSASDGAATPHCTTAPPPE